MNALNNDVVPTPRTTSGDAIDVDLQRDLVMIVKDGKLATILNCSTGGGYTYVEDGATDVAITPSGHFGDQPGRRRPGRRQPRGTVAATIL